MTASIELLLSFAMTLSSLQATILVRVESEDIEVKYAIVQCHHAHTRRFHCDNIVYKS